MPPTFVFCGLGGILLGTLCRVDLRAATQRARRPRRALRPAVSPCDVLSELSPSSSYRREQASSTARHCKQEKPVDFLARGFCWLGCAGAVFRRGHEGIDLC